MEKLWDLNKMHMKELWKKVHNGQSITDEELVLLIKQCESGLEYLEARGDRFWLATSAAWRDLDTLKGFARSRDMKDILSQGMKDALKDQQDDTSEEIPQI